MRRLWVSSTIRSRPSRAPLPGRKAKKLRKLLSTKSPGAATRNLRRLLEAVVETPPREPRRTHAVSPQARETSPAAPTTAWKDQCHRCRQRPKRKDAAHFRSACCAHSDVSSFQITEAVDITRPGWMRRPRKRLRAIWNCSIGQCRRSRRSGNSLSTHGSQGPLSTPAASPDIVVRRFFRSAAPRRSQSTVDDQAPTELAPVALETPYLGARKPIGSQRLEAVITEAVKNPRLRVRKFRWRHRSANRTEIAVRRELGHQGREIRWSQSRRGWQRPVDRCRAPAAGILAFRGLARFDAFRRANRHPIRSKAP